MPIDHFLPITDEMLEDQGKSECYIRPYAEWRWLPLVDEQSVALEDADVIVERIRKICAAAQARIQTREGA